ncbi:MAG TPA: tellurium resistance protein TerC [Anaerolineae bacterium]|nr:tellurium resistance protein TerC [Anaerolineae bacterium]
MTPVEVIFVVIQLIFLEGILSIDNAAVLGAMVSQLPAHEPIPWPRWLNFMQNWGDRVFGPQRAAALKVGLLGAYAGRALMLLLATIVIENPWLRLLGAAYLFKLGIAHLGQPHEDVENEEAAAMAQKVAGKGFWGVVLSVELADLAFSLDNVVAAVALSPVLWVVLLGVAFGILTMRFAAQIFTVMIEREPVLATAAYMLVLAIGVEVLISDITLLMGHEFHFQSWLKFSISISILVLSVIYAHSSFLQWGLNPIFNVVRKIFHSVNTFIDLFLFPIAWIFKKLFQGIAYLFQQFKPKSHIA